VSKRDVSLREEARTRAAKALSIAMDKDVTKGAGWQQEAFGCEALNETVWLRMPEERFDAKRLWITSNAPP
jgi:hypothetical protein